MIKVLPPELVNKIAAGEVVERPSSVVKELVENSIDADSSQINIIIDTDIIVVEDNGKGIESNDLKKLFTNHSTSKISSIEDLSNITTMGFRGEALSTIAAVSKVDIQSRTQDQNTGFSIKSNNAELKTVAKNFGTKITVKDLFYNTPARKKFLKSEPYENKHIIDIVTKIAISHPQVGFKLSIKEKLIFNLIPSSLDNRVTQIIPNIKMIPMMQDDIITGFISRSKDSFNKSAYQYMFVNGRYIQPSPSLSKAVFLGYKNSLMRGQYPPYVIFINLKSDQVDVNVHPRKIEVRFENEGYIFQKIYNIIQHTLFSINKENISQEHNVRNPEINFPSESQNNFSYEYSIPNNTEFERKYDKSFYANTEGEVNSNNAFNSYSVNTAMQFSSELLKDEDELKNLHLENVSQYLSSYITCSTDNAIIIFDQHACSERFLFEKYMTSISGEEIKLKPLLIPEIVPQEYAELILGKKDLLKTFGITMEKLNDQVTITAIPDFANLRTVKELYADLESMFDEDINSVRELREKMITTLACHSAIRFGDTLNKQECKKIIDDLQTCTNKYTCPHGRPTFYKMEKDLLKEIFKR